MLLLALFAFTACVTSPTKDPRAFDRAPLYGMVYDLGNRPVGKAELAVDGNPAASSDVTGRFVLPDLARGDHRILATKEGYEVLTVPLSFLDDTQVLYLQMSSQQQLLACAETKIEAMEWRQARSLLERSASIDSSDPVHRYITAILDWRLGRPREAAGSLQSLIADGFGLPPVYLFLADILQFQLADPEEAARALRSYLELRSDPQIQKRLAALEGATER